MKGLLLCCLLAVATAAPQHWSLNSPATPHHRYAPARSNYKYLPTLEDADEGPLGRQEAVGVAPSQTQAPSLVAAPVVEPAKEAPPQPPAHAPQSRPIGPPQSAGKPVQRPPFRPPPSSANENEEEEEDDESDEADDESDEDDDENEEEEEEEERKRQEKLPEQPESESASISASSVAQKPSVVKSGGSPVPVSVESSVEDVQGIPSVESNEVVSTSDIVGLDDGMEALVPGYVTDQGEVLVPVDTITGDQHISIVPDPYTRERHSAHAHHSFRSAPIFYDEGDYDY